MHHFTTTVACELSGVVDFPFRRALVQTNVATRNLGSRQAVGIVPFTFFFDFCIVFSGDSRYPETILH